MKKKNDINPNYIWDFYASGGTKNLLKKISKINKIKKKINIVFIGNKAGLLETMQEIERLIYKNKINLNIISISRSFLTLQKAQNSKNFKKFKFKFFTKINIKKIKLAVDILDLLILEFNEAKKNGFNKYDVWTNILKGKLLVNIYKNLSVIEKENYNYFIFPKIRNMTRYTYPETVSAKNRLERAKKIKSIKDKVDTIIKFKNYLVIQTKKKSTIKCDIIVNVSGPVSIIELKDEISIVSSLKKLTNMYNQRGFSTNNNFMLEKGIYLPGTLSNNFNPGRETIIKAITKNSHKVAKNIF